MNIEQDVFNKSKVIFDKLVLYGFVENNGIYTFEKDFMNESFKAIISIDKKGCVSGKVIDLFTNEEYVNIRVDSYKGKFISTVREEYINILKDIKNKCFEEFFFISDQANRITNYIKEKYDVNPEFLWEKYSGYGVFRNKNEKWFGIVTNIDKKKISNSSGEIEIINVKLPRNKVVYLLQKKGYYPAYHMNKKDWISIILDDTLPDKEIEKLIDESYDSVSLSDCWIVPANPKYYDILNCFNDSDTIDWKPSNNVNFGDTIYIYVTEPYSKIFFKCKIVESNINLNNKAMCLKLVKTFLNGITFKDLNNIGIKAVRAPRRVSKKISKIIDKYK